MFTRCPYCHTYFRIHADHIKKAGGKVRCGRCFKVFNSIGNLLEQLPVSLEEREQHIAAENPAVSGTKPSPKPVVNTANEKPGATDKATPETDTEPKEDLERIDGIEVSPGEHREMILHPGNEDEADNRLIIERILWAVGAAALVFVFVFQYSYFKRGELMKQAEFRPWVQWVCNVTNCDLPLLSDASQVELAHRDIASHPKTKNALLITAVLINNAPFTQPYPAMEIRLSDISGRTVAKRTFFPNEYLDANVNLRQGMPSDSPIQIALEIHDPGQNAINFEFNFKEWK